MTYVLEHSGEATRLEYQATLSNYLLRDELTGLSIEPGSLVLDAGCGSGLLSRHLVDQFAGIDVIACDASSQRIAQAKQIAAGTGRYKKIRFIEDRLEDLSIDTNSVDWVFCRFVLEHLTDPLQATKEFFRVVKPGGSICLIDLDGILFNLYSESDELREMLESLRRAWITDLFIGRKQPALLRQSGFRDIRWKGMMMQFHGQDLASELELTRQRLEFIYPTVEKILGSSKRADRFNELYIEEMQKPEATLFYNKFVVYGRKA